MPSYLFHSQGLGSFTPYLTPETLFAFDLDGTLAPIVEDHASAKVPKKIAHALRRLMGLAKVAVITGRSRRDAISILGFEPQVLIGNHGAESPFSDNSRNWEFVQTCLKWREMLHDALFYEPGLEIEFKGESISIHYRKSADPEQALGLIHKVVEVLEPHPKLIGGKYVVNLLPQQAFGKGSALESVMERVGAKNAIYFGDDETDEDVFRLEHDGILGIHVGRDESTAAAFYLNQQSEMLELLESMIAILERRFEEGAGCEAALS